MQWLLLSPHNKVLHRNPVERVFLMPVWNLSRSSRFLPLSGDMHLRDKPVDDSHLTLSVNPLQLCTELVHKMELFI